MSISERNIQPGHLVYLLGRSQWRLQGGIDTSAGICIAVHDIGVETHVDVQRFHDKSESAEFVTVDAEILGSAGLIIKASPTDNFVILKDLSSASQFHSQVPICALSTDGWALVKADPFLGEAHWIPGTFERGKPTPGYYFGPEGRDDKFHVVGQGYSLSDQTLEQLRLNGVDLTGRSSFSPLRICSFLDDAPEGDQKSW